MIDPNTHPALAQLVRGSLDFWPDHSGFLEKSFAGRSAEALQISDDLATAILKLSQDVPGNLETLYRDYRFLCEDIVLPEEIHFRRHGRYRLSSFEDAFRECYGNAEYMGRYMNGLLLSNVFWDNHAQAFNYFVSSYLPLLKPGARHLEIGPGHGLFLYFASLSPAVTSVTGWDVSPTSIAQTRHALDTLGAPKVPDLIEQNMFDVAIDDGAEQFDSLVMSEILEHLEDPTAALAAAGKVLAPGGLLFVNVPANSPAPDHIFLFESPEHATELVAKAGFEIVDSAAFPMSGTTLERARKHKLAISCVVVGRKP